jgi:hypothetical protein
MGDCNSSKCSELGICICGRISRVFLNMDNVQELITAVNESRLNNTQKTELRLKLDDMQRMLSDVIQLEVIQ